MVSNQRKSMERINKRSDNVTGAPDPFLPSPNLNWSSQNFLNEIDDRLKDLKKVFALCEDFDQTARLFDDVTAEGYKKRASNRTQSLREAVRIPINPFNIWSDPQLQPTRLESRYKELRSDVDEEMRLKEQLERVAEEDRRSCCRSAINIIIKYKEENEKSHVIKMELKLLMEDLTNFQVCFKTNKLLKCCRALLVCSTLPPLSLPCYLLSFSSLTSNLCRN